MHASSFQELPNIQLETASGAHAEPKHKDILVFHVALPHHRSPVGCDHCTCILPFAHDNPHSNRRSLLVRDLQIISWKVHIPRDVLQGKLPCEVLQIIRCKTSDIVIINIYLHPV